VVTDGSDDDAGFGLPAAAVEALAAWRLGEASLVSRRPFGRRTACRTIAALQGKNRERAPCRILDLHLASTSDGGRQTPMGPGIYHGVIRFGSARGFDMGCEMAQSMKPGERRVVGSPFSVRKTSSHFRPRVASSPCGRGGTSAGGPSSCRTCELDSSARTGRALTVGITPAFCGAAAISLRHSGVNKKAAPEDGSSRCGEYLSKGIHKHFFLSHVNRGTPPASLH